MDQEEYGFHVKKIMPIPEHDQGLLDDLHIDIKELDEEDQEREAKSFADLFRAR